MVRRERRSSLILLSIVALFLLLSIGCSLLFLDPDLTGDPEDNDAKKNKKDYGEETIHWIEDIKFSMRLAPPATFPIGLENDREAIIENGFWIAETQVTYALWHTVLSFAKENGYRLANLGREGGDLEEGNIGGPPTKRSNEPVTTINWRDSIVWCNALTELHNQLHGTEYEIVYRINDTILRDATDETIPLDEITEKGDGFRLPTSLEWELAARYQGADDSYGAIESPKGQGIFWAPGDYASGATADYQDYFATREAAWYYEPYSSRNKTKDVGQKPPTRNGLGVFDMSGNVWEWCSDFIPGYEQFRVLRGGSWYNDASQMQVGYVVNYAPSYAGYGGGLRVVRGLSP